MTEDGPLTYDGMQLIGSNGFAHTYRAWAPALEDTVVLKVYALPDPLLEAAAFVADLARIGDVDHPALAHPLEGGVTDDGRPYVVRRRLAGHPLSGGDDAEPVGLDDLHLIAGEVAAALAALHLHGVVHGALTPDNVLVELGVGRTVTRLTDPLPATVARARPTGFRHDPAFVAPEVLDLGIPSPEGDVYSLAATVSAALGRLAAPVELHDVLEACLSPRPEDRPTAAALAERLADAVGGGGPVDEGPDRARPRTTIPLAATSPDVLRRRIEPGALPPPDVSGLYTSRASTRRWVPERPRRWAAVTALGAAVLGGTVLAPDVLASRATSDFPPVTAAGVRLADRAAVPSVPATTTAPASDDPGDDADHEPDELRVAAAALVRGPARQAQLKVALHDAPTPAGTTLVALVGRTGTYTPPAGPSLAARRLATTTTELGVRATEGETFVTALPSNPVGVSEEFHGPDGRTRSTFASRADAPVFYVPAGSELLGVASIDDEGRIRSFAPAAGWPPLQSANSF